MVTDAVAGIGIGIWYMPAPAIAIDAAAGCMVGGEGNAMATAVGGADMAETVGVAGAGSICHVRGDRTITVCWPAAGAAAGRGTAALAA